MTTRESRGVAVVAAPPAFDALEPLLAAYRARRPVHAVPTAAAPALGALTEIAAGADAVLLVGPRRRSPRTVLPGPLLHAGDRRVPVGWLPDTGPEALRRFALAAARVHRRPTGPAASAALLGQRRRRYEDLSARIGRLLEEGERPLRVYGWTADKLVREDMLRGMGCGLALGIYVGHGRPVGWVGYRGTRSHHFAGVAEPTAAVLSLTCVTASRKRVGLSFSEALPLVGAAAAAFGAVVDTLHTDNSRWALRLARALTEGSATIGEVVARAVVRPDETSSRYRILGDPLAPLRDAPDAGRLAANITQEAALQHAS